MEQLLTEIQDYTGQSGGWIVQVFIVVFATLMLDFIQKSILRRIHKRLEMTKTLWDDAVVESIRAPLSLLIWIVGMAFAKQSRLFVN